ncbi:MAG: peptidase U34 [Chloroflexi bacterium]|nr:peptidase U34 [Chloroflexota bacterium]
MCDTFVAAGSATKDGSVIFGKNSDREPNEAHVLEIHPAADHPEGAQVKCTYMEIPQAVHTHAVLLAKPFWIWGAEMGANEYGLVIGNEAVFTKMPLDKTGGLIGMDFLRLALERSTTADEGLQCIVGLLKQYGQGGNCGFTHPFYYHNSFILADSEGAWVLETAGSQWAAKKVEGMRSISNRLSIGTDWDLASDDLVDTAIERGWCKSRRDFHFARCYSDVLYTRLSDSEKRQQSAQCQLEQMSGRLTVESAMRILRSHTVAAEKFSPDSGLLGADVCMHAGFGPVRGSQTVGSMVSHLREPFTHWVTGTSAPCLSLFKPVWIDSGLPTGYEPSTGVYNEKSLFWKHEQLHRKVIFRYHDRAARIHSDIDRIQASWLAAADGHEKADRAQRGTITTTAFAEEETGMKSWAEALGAEAGPDKFSLLYGLAWKRHNREANLPPR